MSLVTERQGRYTDALGYAERARALADRLRLDDREDYVRLRDILRGRSQRGLPR